MENTSIQNLSSGLLSKQDVENKRKKKEVNRRKVKEQRKNRIKENRIHAKPASMDREAIIKKKNE